MLATKYVLRGNQAFARVEKEGRMIQSDSFGLAFFDRKDNELSKYGFIVSNKISGDSTLRNRVKRALKAAVRYGLADIKNGYDVVFLAKQRILQKSTDEIMKEVNSGLKEAGLYK